MTTPTPDPTRSHAVSRARRDLGSTMWTVLCSCGVAVHNVDREAAESAMEPHRTTATVYDRGRAG